MFLLSPILKMHLAYSIGVVTRVSNPGNFSLYTCIKNKWMALALKDQRNTLGNLPDTDVADHSVCIYDKLGFLVTA